MKQQITLESAELKAIVAKALNIPEKNRELLNVFTTAIKGNFKSQLKFSQGMGKTDIETEADQLF